jgi:SAM-dependent MidA family methyltransferase
MKPSKELPGEAVRQALLRRAGGRPAVDFAEFMQVALYDPEAGYYRRDGPRIGYGAGTDFLTATASAPLLGRLVAAACTRLLAPEAPGGYEFVEVGAERGAGILGDLPHPFRSARIAGIGDTLHLSGPTVVFSNELLDAQPFRRFRFRAGGWREIGVAVGERDLEEVELARDAQPGCLPASAPEGYVIDAPLAAADLLRAIAALPWSGLFVAFDYGKSWEEISTCMPEGTARSYRRHVQGSDLLAFPGEQDLTCHVCWDWLKDALRDSGFAEPTLESQEAFLVRHAGDVMGSIAASAAGGLSRDKLSLLQLLHPANLGQKFQVLWALRAAPGPSQNPLA